MTFCVHILVPKINPPPPVCAQPMCTNLCPESRYKKNEMGCLTCECESESVMCIFRIRGYPPSQPSNTHIYIVRHIYSGVETSAEHLYTEQHY